MKRENDKRFINVVPTERQVSFQNLEFYSFVHFTVNTFTGKEWGDGSESPLIFNPINFDAKQWVEGVKSAGMKGLILTCKHHDGFCLWPSRHTTHTIAKSPFRDGEGDIVKEVSDACHELGIKFGVYLSPWDRNSEFYGQGKPYDDYFIEQLTELLTNYGEIFTCWFDGACGEGKNGKKQVYDWERYYKVIRKLQPNACINVCGPDIRWCGNEAGDTRTAEWSVVPQRMKDTEKIAEESQQADDHDFTFRLRKVSSKDKDLGSRNILENEKKLIWYPAEINTSIRPGWFYHEEEDNKVRSLDELINIYYNSVGGNGTFLLNIPPTKEGLFHKEDMKRLKEIGDYLGNAFHENLTNNAKVSVDSFKSGHEISKAMDDNYVTWFMTEDDVTSCEILLQWDKVQTISHIILKENIHYSQRIESFSVEAGKSGIFETIYEGCVVGHKKIIPIKKIEANEIKIRILDARVSITLAFIGVY